MPPFCLFHLFSPSILSPKCLPVFGTGSLKTHRMKTKEVRKALKQYADPKELCEKCGVEVLTEENPSAWTLSGGRQLCDSCYEARARSPWHRMSEPFRRAWFTSLPPRSWWRLSPPYALRRWYAGLAFGLLAIGFCLGLLVGHGCQPVPAFTKSAHNSRPDTGPQQRHGVLGERALEKIPATFVSEGAQELVALPADVFHVSTYRNLFASALGMRPTADTASNQASLLHDLTMIGEPVRILSARSQGGIPTIAFPDQYITDQIEVPAHIDFFVHSGTEKTAAGSGLQANPGT